METQTGIGKNNQTISPTGSKDTELASMAPGTLRVIRRNGAVTAYDDSKISVAVTKAFLAVEGGTAASSTRIHEKVAQLTKTISETFHRRMPTGGTLHIEDIQDLVELSLMREGEREVARAYVLYREEHRKARESSKSKKKTTKKTTVQAKVNVTLSNGTKAPLDVDRVNAIVAEAKSNLPEVSGEAIIDEALRNIYDGIPAKEVTTSLIMSARAMVEKDPSYTYATARLLLDSLRSEALQFLGMQESATLEEMKQVNAEYFKRYLECGVKHELIAPELLKFDLDKLTAAMDLDRDLQFTYLSLQTLYDRYFIHADKIRFELPQAFFMRVAMGLAASEEDKEARAIEFYNVLSTFKFMSSTPTLFNSGTLRPQLSSCFLTTIPDDLSHIFGAFRDNALLSKFAGGIGNDWTPVRAMGSHIKGTNGTSLGVVPFMNVADATAIAVNQGGKRKGAVCGYLETWHMDIEDFIELRKNTGDDRRRTHDMNTANWVPDLFLERVSEEKEWTLFSPDDVPDLHDLYGKAFREKYEEYEELARQGKMKVHKVVSAVNLWRKMLGMLFETGHPWLTFKDACNIRSPQQHCGVIHSSNLCTEITLNTSVDEVAVCNLGSLNLPAHVDENGLNAKEIEKTVNTAIRMLDNVIDINYYTIPQARRSNLRHRPIGLGIMGFHDALYKQKLQYASAEGVEFADRSMEMVSYYTIKASTNLAEERGTYETFSGSLWEQGILPFDSLKLLKAERGQYLDYDETSTLDWDSLRERVKKIGMRNSNVMAIAPTATISNICGVSQSIEPTYQNLYVKSNMSGEFTVVNPYLVADLKALNLWDDVMVNDLKYFDGSLQQIDRVPDELKQRYATAFELEPRWLVEAGARRQKWIDQSQSLNLYMAEPSGKKLDVLYRMAWIRGLKTTYYLRSKGATTAEKSTITTGALNAVSSGYDAAPKACSLDDPDCEACQ